MKTWKLRPYQQEAVDQINKLISDGHDKIGLSASVSFGKSSVIVELTKNHQANKVLIVVNHSPLLPQLAELLDIYNLDYETFDAKSTNQSFTSNIVLAMAQTLHARIKSNKINPTQFSIMLQDEFHVANSNYSERLQSVVQHFNIDTQIGVSGTPYNASGVQIAGWSMVNTAPPSLLTKQGYLCQLKHYVPHWAEKIDYSNVSRTSTGEYDTDQLDAIIANDSHIQLAVASIKELSPTIEKTIIFTSSVKQADELTLALQSNGYPGALAVHSKIKKKQSDAIIEAFKRNQPYTPPTETESTLFTNNEPLQHIHITHLVSVAKLSIGFSVEDIKVGVFFSKIGSKSKYFQQLGRICRTHADKQFGKILDLAQVTSDNGFLTDDFIGIPDSGSSAANRSSMFSAHKHLDMSNLITTLEPDTITEVTREQYNIKLEELVRSAKKLSELTVPELSNRLKIEDDLLRIFAVIFAIFDKVLCDQVYDNYGNLTRGYTASNGKLVANFYNEKKIMWVAEKWIIVFNSPTTTDYQRHKWSKSLKTRAINMVKQDKSIYGLAFFIEYLLEQDDLELSVDNEVVSKYAVVQETPDIEIEDDDAINMDDCPF